MPKGTGKLSSGGSKKKGLGHQKKWKKIQAKERQRGNWERGGGGQPKQDSQSSKKGWVEWTQWLLGEISNKKKSTGEKRKGWYTKEGKGFL